MQGCSFMACVQFTKPRYCIFASTSASESTKASQQEGLAAIRHASHELSVFICNIIMKHSRHEKSSSPIASKQQPGGIEHLTSPGSTAWYIRSAHFMARVQTTKPHCSTFASTRTLINSKVSQLAGLAISRAKSSNLLTVSFCGRIFRTFKCANRGFLFEFETSVKELRCRSQTLFNSKSK